jgi:hypothetical protein
MKQNTTAAGTSSRNGSAAMRVAPSCLLRPNRLGFRDGNHTTFELPLNGDEFPDPRTLETFSSSEAIW